MARDKDKIIQVSLGDDASLDVIKMDDLSILFVIAERGSVQHRTVATVNVQDAIRIAKFLVGIEDVPNE